MREKSTKELEQERRLHENLSRIKNKLIVISGKGGVGKTTVAVNLAYGLAMKGYEVGILDADIHGPNIAKMLGIEGKKLEGSNLGIEPVQVLKNLKAVSISLFMESQDQPIIWRGPLKTSALKQFLSDVNWGNLNYLIVDSPPGTGDEPLSICQFISDVNGAIIVTTPQDVAILDSKKSVEFAKQLKVPVVGIIENMSGFICPNCKKEIDLFGAGGGEKAANNLEVPFLGRIPIEPEVVKSGDLGHPFIHSEKESSATKNMNVIVDKIEENINQPICKK